jgi:small GTP-binding protein
VILLGDPGVGKTSIVQQYNVRQFDEVTEPTIGASLVSKLIRTAGGSVQIHIWDAAGQERYRSLVPMYTRNAAAAIIVVNVTNIESYRALDSWLCVVREHSGAGCQVFVAANKMDLDVVIPMHELERWCAAHECQFFRVCAKEFEGVDRLFQKVADGLEERATLETAQREERRRPKEPCC